MKREKATYSSPEVKVILVQHEDILTTSGNELEPDVNQ